MQINTNLLALNNNRQLATADNNLSRSLQRLSSGLRINSAKDDSAGLAISERMSSQIRGMNQAKRNANDGISKLQTAEGVMSSVSEMLQRIRELSVQAANGTNSSNDKESLASEAGALVAEIQRIGTTASFNGQNLFKDFGTSEVGDTSKLPVLDGLKAGWLARAEGMIKQYYGIQGDGAAMSIELGTFTDGVGNTAARVASNVGGSGQGTNLKLQIDMADFVPSNLPNGGNAPFYNDRIITHEMVHAVMARATNWGDIVNNNTWFAEGTAEFIHGADERLSADIAASGVAAVVAKMAGAWANASINYSAAYAATRYLHEKIQAAGGGGIKDVLAYMQANLGQTLDQAFAATTPFASVAAFKASFAANGVAFIGTMDLTNTDTGAVGGLDADGGAIKTAESVNDMSSNGYTDNPLEGFSETWEAMPTGGLADIQTLQVGGNANQTIDISMGGLSSTALDLTGLDLRNNAWRGIVQVDRALDYVNGERAKYGAQMNRLESTISNLQTGVETQSAAKSRISDADFAKESASHVRNQIISQVGVAMASVANATPRFALRLLSTLR